MRYYTRLRLETWAIMAAVYGGLAAMAAFVGARIYLGIQRGWITFGRTGEMTFHLEAEPVRFWFVIVWHLAVVLAAVGGAIYFAAEMRHLGIHRLVRFFRR
jgi:hypothetical protein